jgi:hypothetical protein
VCLFPRMKRPLPTAVDVVVASVSQASIPGAEQACTSIAVLACAASLSSSTRPLPDDMEFWMWQAALLKRDMAFAKEVVNLLSPALPIACGNEVGGMGPEQLQNVLATVELPAVLTVGAVSVALLPIHSRQQQQQQQQQQLSDALRVVGLFDSHPQAAHDYKAVYWELESMQEVVAHFAMSPMTQFALCEVRSRPFRHVAGSVPASVANGGLIVFPDQEDAFRAADTLPPGFLDFHSARFPFQPFQTSQLQQPPPTPTAPRALPQLSAPGLKLLQSASSCSSGARFVAVLRASTRQIPCACQQSPTGLLPVSGISCAVRPASWRKLLFPTSFWVVLGPEFLPVLWQQTFPHMMCYLSEMSTALRHAFPWSLLSVLVVLHRSQLVSARVLAKSQCQSQCRPYILPYLVFVNDSLQFHKRTRPDQAAFLLGVKRTQPTTS